MELKLEIDTPPQGRPRFNRKGYTYDASKSRAFKIECAMLILSQIKGEEKFTGEVRVVLRIYRAARQFKKGATSVRYGDIDNLAKAILDAITMTGAVWKDDRQVVEMHVWKLIAEEPRVELTIEEVGAQG